MKLAKVRITDNRPHRAGRAPGQYTGSARETAEHDAAVADMGKDLLLRIARDIGGRRVNDRSQMENRWIMARRAAVLRKLEKEGWL